MGASTLLTNTEIVTFTYTLFDGESNEWQIMVRAIVSLGSPAEQDEKGIRYDGDQPSVDDLKMYWSFSDGKDASVLHKSFMPTPMIEAVELAAISRAKEQAFQKFNS